MPGRSWKYRHEETQHLALWWSDSTPYFKIIRHGSCQHFHISEVVPCWKKCTTPELQVLLGANEDCSLGDSISDSSEKLLWEGKRGARMYRLLQQRADRNIKRLLLIKESQISQVKEFCAFSEYGKIRESGLTEIMRLICTSAIWGQNPVLFTSWASSLLTIGSACSLMAARGQELTP